MLGVASGIGYGLLGVGLVLTFRASRVLNLAHGQIGAFAAVILLEAANAGAPYWAAAAAAVASAALIGAAVEAGVVRRMASGPPVIAMVATLGVAQVLLLASQGIGRSATARELYPQPAGIPDFDVGVLTVVPANVALLVLGPAIVLLLWLVLGRTGIGLALRAAAANPQGARALGIPAGRMATLTWAVAGALAAFTAILVVPATSGFPTAEALGPSLLLRALAAAAIGRFWSLPATLAGGLAIGLIEQVVIWNTDQTAYVSLILLGVVFVAMLLLRPAGGRLAEQGSWAMVASLPRLPAAVAARPAVRAARLAAAGAAVAAAALAPLVFDSPELLDIACIGIAGVSAWLVVALGGQLSLGQFALAGVGATFAANFAATTGSPVAGFAAAMVGGGTVAAILALPALRDRGLGLAVTTLAFAAAAVPILGQDWALGSAAEPARLVDGETASYELALAVLVLSVVLAARLAAGPAGRRLRAARDNESAARALGVPVAGLRLRSVALAGAVAGLAGALLAQGLFAVTPDQFRVTTGIDAVAVAVVGGLGSALGPLLGTVAIVAVPSLAGFSSTALAAVAIGWLAILIVVPGGLASAAVRLRDRVLVRAEAAPAPAAAPRAWTAPAGPAPGRLEVGGASVSFGEVRALDGVSLVVEPGEAVGIVGPNGSGKSTLVDVICGAVQPGAGTVSLGGEDIGWMSPNERAGRGLVRSQQDGRLFPTLTPLDLVQLSLERNLPERMVSGVFRGSGGARTEALAALRGLGLAGYAEMPIRELSTGTRRFAELAAMLASRPSILVLDEPSAGIAQAERGPLAELLNELRERGDLSLVVIEHDLELVAAVTDRIVRLDAGREVGAPAQAPTPATPRPAAPGPAPEPVLEGRGLRFAYDVDPILDGADVVLGRGEFVAVLGPNGAGKSTLLRVLSGLLRPDGGAVLRAGADVTGEPADALARGGLAVVEAGSATFGPLTVAESLRLSLAGGDPAEVLAEFPELERRIGTRTAALSMGERQLLALAQAFARRPDVLLVDDLGLGLAPGAADRMTAALGAIRARGAGVMVVDQSYELLLGLADRAYWLEDGHMRFAGDPAALRSRNDLLRPVFLAPA